MAPFHSLPFEQRKRESERVLKKYEGKVPIIIEPANKRQPAMKTGSKYLVSADMTVQSLMYFVRKRIPSLQVHEALWLFSIQYESGVKTPRTSVVPTSQSLGAVYHSNKSDDGFVYIHYSLENTFG